MGDPRALWGASAQAASDAMTDPMLSDETLPDRTLSDPTRPCPTPGPAMLQTGPALPPWAEDPLNRTVDRYILGPELGRGGMGRVHRAWDPVLRREVALKLLHSQDPEQHVRLMREAQSQAKLDHPGICRIHDLGDAEGTPYIAMQLIRGASLADLRPGLSPADTARILADVASAVHAAHRAGLVHRDLKPSNILVETRADGAAHPYVVDFGLARDLSAPDLTLSWAVMGTPAFMSPEQARGEHPGPASDLYSLGATLYAMLSGKPPYEGATLAGLVTRQSTEGIRPLRRLEGSIPKDLATIVHKCLEYDPERRYASAFALEEDLRRFLAGEPIRARAVGPLGRVQRWVKRNPRLAATAAAGLLTAGLLGAWNLRTLRLARLREQVAQRFGMEVRDAEHLLRIERMMPTHDIRPAEARLRNRMDLIRQEMDRIGATAQGPGHYALARGHLALREFQPALACLDRAWATGFTAPEVAYTQGLARLLLWQDRFGIFATSSTAALKSAHQELVAPALAWLRRAQGAQVEVPEYVAGLVAMVEGRDGDAEALLAETFRKAPWQYEALLARGRNTMMKALRPGEELQWDKLDGLFQQADGLYREAFRLAPSDHRAAMDLVQLHAGRFTQESARKRRSLEPLDRASHYLAQARIIRPDRDLGSDTHYVMQRAFFLLSTGGDPGALVREEARRLEGLSSTSGYSSADFQDRSNSLRNLYWVAAEADWRFGRDPSRALARCYEYGGIQNSDDPHQVYPRLVELQWRSARGLPLRPLLDDTEALVQRAIRAIDNGWSRSIAGEFFLEKARGLLKAGGGAREALRQARLQLEAGVRKDPHIVYTYYYLPRVHALEARLDLQAGREAGPAVRAALAAARRGLEIDAGNAQVRLAEADAHLVEGLWRAARGEDPLPAWALARAALAAGHRINPRFFELFRCEAELERAAATNAAARGEDPAPFQARLRTVARQGLAVKRDDPVLRPALLDRPND